MLIGIDMLGVQSPEGRVREAGRLGRQLVAALLDGEPTHRYVLYTHEGLPTDRIPSSRSAVRVSIAPMASSDGPTRLRPATQRLLDRNPDGLDWMILLDPFEPNYGGLPPERPLGGPRVASILHDLAPALVDDRRLSSLGRHDALLAVSTATAGHCRRRLGPGSAWRISTIGVASDSTFAAPGPSDPLSKVDGDSLGRLGIDGPFLFANLVGGADRDNLRGLLDAYALLPIEHRRRHQLVIGGDVADPDSARSVLRRWGCEGSLVLAGELPEAALKSLYGRCSAFLAPSIEEGSGQSIVEAMRSGAPVLTGRGGSYAALVGDAGLLVDPTDPAEIASELSELLADGEVDHRCRRASIARGGQFPWGPVVASVLSALADGTVSTPAPRPRPNARVRFDGGHGARPRIAVFPDVPRGARGRIDLASRVPADWSRSFGVDLYLNAGDSALADGLPPGFGVFDSRLFDRNDGLIGYHAVAYRCGVDGLDALIGRIAKRPGLVFPLDDDWLDRIAPEAPSPSKSRGIDNGSTGRPAETIRAIEQLRALLLTRSRVVVRSPRHADQLRATFPEFADQVAEIPPTNTPRAIDPAKVRARLDLLPGTVLIGQFVGDGDAGPPLGPRAFKAVAKAVPGAILITIGGDGSKSRRESKRHGIADRSLHAGPVDPAVALEIASALDLAIHPGPGPAQVGLLDLLRLGVPTIALESDLPASIVRVSPRSADGIRLARAVRDLAIDAEGRTSMGRAAREDLIGVADPARASALLLDEIERCANVLPGAGGRRPRRLEPGPLGLAFSPHFPRQASVTDEAAPVRGER